VSETTAAVCPVITRGTCFFFSSRRRHTRSKRDWSSDVCSSDLHAHRQQHVGGQKDRDRFIFTAIAHTLRNGVPHHGKEHDGGGKEHDRGQTVRDQSNTNWCIPAADLQGLNAVDISYQQQSQADNC